jgi:hypothetical protein
MGAWSGVYTADRDETKACEHPIMIEAMRRSTGGKPLNLAVFGPPGAGKSFGICEIARGILGKEVPILEFNLSQFKNPDELTGSFHQVRDKALGGITPVVFWDEFDSNEYFWLQYLLAPMQDGKFMEGQITHPVGKSVFVFAGGTSFDMENFGPKETDEKKWNEFKLKKGPDFKSRLSGYLNVLGPNRRQKYDANNNVWMDDREDICYPVRRALLIRAMLGLKDHERLDIDHGILSALIETYRFKHGARSMEKILLQLKKPGVASIWWSDLPPSRFFRCTRIPRILRPSSIGICDSKPTPRTWRRSCRRFTGSLGSGKNGSNPKWTWITIHCPWRPRMKTAQRRPESRMFWTWSGCTPFPTFFRKPSRFWRSWRLSQPI